MDFPVPLPPPDPKLRGQGPVSEWYNGRSIFITGASGFMGKVLMEKLLYQCIGIKHIYILLRSKRGRMPEQRIEDMWKLPMFQRLRKYDPGFIEKIIPVHGDVLTEGLGLSAEALRPMIEEVSVVFHCAATLKLEAKLRDAVEMNTAGTVKVLEVAKKIKNLKVFVHLSTAFCSADLEEFKEQMYPTVENPREIIQVVEWMKDDALEAATEKIIHPHPNTYTYTKRLAENIVAEEYPNMPVVIARPAIVTPAGHEPLPGWVDSLNGPMGLVVGAGKGVIRTMHVKADYRAQVIPVDVAISALIVMAWKRGSATVNPPQIPVYNLTNDGAKRMCWGDTLTIGRDIAYKYPFEQQIWYPDGDFRSTKLMHKICCFFFHWIPAYLIDFLMLIFGQKRFMIRLMRRIDFGLDLLQFFSTREWFFESKNFLSLNTDMTPLDRQIYPIDFEAMSVDLYMTLSLLGARQYLMKEDLSTIPRCRRVQSLLYVLDRAFALAFYLGLIWLLCSCSDTVKDFFDFVGYYVHHVPILGSLIPHSYK